ncbi:RNA-guided endonuclease InsQ/TnpB family protein, partial [Lactobacillus amylovorus]
MNKYCLRIGTRKPMFVETSSLNRLKHKMIKRMMVVYRADLDRFYLSFVVADQKEELPQYQAKTQKTGKMIGIDVGLGNEWLVTSDNHRW